jgi:hypothetical protein
LSRLNLTGDIAAVHTLCPKFLSRSRNVYLAAESKLFDDSVDLLRVFSHKLKIGALLFIAVSAVQGVIWIDFHRGMGIQVSPQI